MQLSFCAVMLSIFSANLKMCKKKELKCMEKVILIDSRTLARRIIIFQAEIDKLSSIFAVAICHHRA
jgi:hypothetical protein